MEQQIAYELNWDISLLEGREEFTHYANLAKSTCPETRPIKTQLYQGEPVTLPEELLFDSVEDFVADCDYPYTDTSWPIMSQRMIDVLLSVRSLSIMPLLCCFEKSN